MNKYIVYLLFPAFAYMLSVCLTRLCITVLPKVGLIDQPGGRHIHEEATPKGGGLAIIIAFIVSWLVFAISPWNYFTGNMDLKLLCRLAVPLTLLAGIGIIDDRYEIRALYKLIGQVIVAALTWYFGVRLYYIFGYFLPNYLSFILTVVWLTGFINAFNLIDGLDGLAAGLGIVSSVCMAVIFIFAHAPLNTVIVLCLSAACLGFLRYNFHPAKIFMGDTGSMFLGFMLALLGILSANKLATFSAVFLPILAAGVPVFDVFLAIWRRVSRRILHQQANGIGSQKKRLMEGDREHLHHRILDQNQSQTRTTLFIYGIAVILGVIALLTVLLKGKAQGIAFIIVLIAFVTAIRRLATVELWNSAKVLVNGLHRPQKSLLISLAHPFIDISVLSCSFLLSHYLVSTSEFTPDFIRNALIVMTYNIIPSLLLLHFGRVYRRVWFQASSNDYFVLFELLLIGHVANFLIQLYVTGSVTKTFCTQYLLFFLLSTSLIITERMSLRYLKSSLISNLYLKHQFSGKVTNVLIYGTGLNCRFLLYRIYTNIEKDPVRIVGIVDDVPTLRKQYVYGYQVLGTSSDLEDIQNNTPFDKLIISSSSLSTDTEKNLREFCRENGIPMTQLVFREDEKLTPTEEVL